jgi:hypothetical protein
MAPDHTDKKLIRVRLSLQVSYNLPVGELIELPESPDGLDGERRPGPSEVPPPTETSDKNKK